MKYIRTKDGIKSICGENHILKSVSYYNTRRNLCSYKTETNRYKIADTIEELCDSWILVDRDNVQPIAFNINEDNIAKTYKDNKDKHNFTLFAAIWVFDSNGAPTLKPVAKMNDKGELELL